nr:MAG TPA: hypothetical protein [Caudoviricetes sp.]
MVEIGACYVQPHQRIFLGSVYPVGALFVTNDLRRYGPVSG